MPTPKKPSGGGGNEPRYVREQRQWGAHVVDAINQNRNRAGFRSPGGQMPLKTIEWDHALSFAAEYENKAEYSGTHPLVVAAGNVVAPTTVAVVATANIALPVSGDLYVYVAITLGATPSGVIASNATAPDYRSAYDTINVILGIMTEVETGYWDWDQRHSGDIFLGDENETGEYGVGFWGEIQSSGSGVYAGDILDRDASTDTATNFANAVEVSGREGIPAGSIVWIRPTNDQSGTNDFVFEYHGADAGTVDALDYSDSPSAHADEWERDDQGGTRGVKHQVVARLHGDADTGELSFFPRLLTDEANGHKDLIGAEGKDIFAIVELSDETYEYVDCDTGLVTIARYALADKPAPDYLYVHDGSELVKSFNDGVSAGAATSPLPCTVEMPTATTECGDVDATAFNDDFDDNDLDLCKWKNNQGLWSETGGEAVFSDSGTNSATFGNLCPSGEVSGAFEIEVNLTAFSTEGSGTPTSSERCNLNVSIGGTTYNVGPRYNSSGVKEVTYADPSAGETTVTSLAEIMKITRDGSNNVKLFFGGVQFGSTAIDSGVVSNIRIDGFSGGRSISISLDNFTITP